jgi:YHS domain-containing protein
MTWLSENWLFVLLLAGALIFMLRCSGMGRGVGGHGTHQDAGHGEPPPFDPVSREPVASDSTIAAVYGGRTYRFASRENRDRIEAAPERFATAQATADPGEHRHGGRGCC